MGNGRPFLCLFCLVLLLTKSCPHEMGKVDTNGCEWPKGERLKAAKCREVFPLSFANAQQLPRFTVEPFGAPYKLTY